MKLKALVFLVFQIHMLFSQQITSREYIEKYKGLAIKEMERTGIPASITMAQGMLESGNGNSRLATKANNHFGIKCHGWQGQKIYHDDDAKGECFRKYKSVYESYEDHSDFLTTTSRYKSLFELRPDDYKSWARGLKRAGYATAPDYDHKLIRIIETYQLHELDKKSETKKSDSHDVMKKIELSGRPVKSNNNIKYITAREGDTYASLADELQLMKWQLPKYNEAVGDEMLNKGDMVYLQPKRNKAATGNKYHMVKEGETMYQISQMYGVKIEKLYEKNQLNTQDELQTGTKLWLRKTRKITTMNEGNSGNKKTLFEKKNKSKTKKEPKIPENDQQELEFKFD